MKKLISILSLVVLCPLAVAWSQSAAPNEAIKGDTKATLIGAAVGCGAGLLVNKQRVKKNNEVADLKKRNARLAQRVNRDEQARQYTAPVAR